MRGLDILKIQLFVLHNTDTVSETLSRSRFLRYNKQQFNNHLWSWNNGTKPSPSIHVILDNTGTKPCPCHNRTQRHFNCFPLICCCGPRHDRENQVGIYSVQVPPDPQQTFCLETLDSCIRWPHHCWLKFWTIQNHIQVQHCGRGW